MVGVIAQCTNQRGVELSQPIDQGVARVAPDALCLRARDPLRREALSVVR
jgi:hypothetical protein